MNAHHDNRRRGGLRRAGTIVAAWLAGGLLVVGVLLATGALSGSSTTKVTTIREAAATTTVADETGAGTADEQLYASTSPGVVEIRSTISGSSSEEAEAQESPFGESGGSPGEEGYGEEGYGGPKKGFGQGQEGAGGTGEGFGQGQEGPGGTGGGFGQGQEGGGTGEGFGQGGEGYGGEEAESAESMATGSGFEVDEEGDVVTAAHVVDEASSVEVIFQDGTTRKAEVLGIDEASDLAVIKFNPEGIELHPLKVGDSSALKVGASVAAIGAPFEYAWSFSTGIVSGLDRTIEAPNGFSVSHAIQTDAAVNPGNSGGPLLDAEGEVIGVVDQIATDGSADQSSGVGFAVPSSLVAAELQQLEAGETVEHAYLGIATATPTEGTEGAEVAEVESGSPAAEGGVKQGDVITELDGEAIDSTEALVAAIAAHKPGETVTLKIERGSSSTSLKVKLGTQPAESGLG
ncbi:MAG TPA: trypsin-like peptidase domain-containing protein [Solirubrobacterales bacterium]|nr:trypsin-like peptidase domain-containing protein [Solirubrobacterales bacterium]